MAVTLKRLIERIRRRLAEGDPSVSDAVQDPELRDATCAAMAEVLKRETLSVHYSLEGGSIPDSCMIATYEGRQVQRGNGAFCRVDLPVTPMILPERVGLFAVYPAGRPLDQFIPLPPGTYNLWVGVPLLSDFIDVLYCAEQRYIDIFADIIGMGITEVDMKIITVDVTSITADDDETPLPIGADMELAVMERVLKLYMPPGDGDDAGGYDREQPKQLNAPQPQQ